MKKEVFKTNHSSSGVGFSELLTIVFIILKLLDVISWSWIWVLSPLWITFILLVIVCVIGGLKFGE